MDVSFNLQRFLDAQSYELQVKNEALKSLANYES